MKRPSPLSTTLLYGGLAAWLLLAALPILWTVVISLRSYVDAFSTPLEWFAPLTLENYRALWIEREFHRNFLNTALVTFGTVGISLTVGCLAGYALARFRGATGFWLLIIALVFRALPHSTLLPSFYAMFDALGIRNTLPTLIFVLVAINQPFTIWMLRSFFVGIPHELDEAAMVDGCTRLQAFRRVIIPVMWPGVVTTGLFSFLLAYNDFMLSSALTNAERMTMPAAIAGAINAESEALLMQGVAGAVSITIPLILLVALFQKQIVSGLTQGAVKGLKPMFVSHQELARRHIRRRQYVACDEAFIDVRLPGSAPKENYSIVGPGVTQSASQVVNLTEPHGFNIGAAGVAPGVTNNLHLHFTAEVFVACEGRFTLRWGSKGDDGEVTLEPGDVICMPPWMFRGFSNAGTEHGFLMTVLGGDDTGGILWSPEVLRRARATGLWLGRHNEMIEVPAGAAPPAEAALLEPMPDADVAALARWSADALLARVLRRGERRYRAATLDAALAGHGWQLAPFVGWGLSCLLGQRPAVVEPQGFSIEWLHLPPGGRSAPFALDAPAVLLHEHGPLEVHFNAGSDVAAAPGPWDTVSLPTGSTRAFVNTGNEPAEALLVVQGDAPKRMRYAGPVAAAAAAIDLALDAGGHLVKKSLLPPSMGG